MGSAGADEAIKKLRDLARVLADAPLPNDAALSIGGLIVGAAYSLAKAVQLDYRNIPGGNRTADYRKQLVDVAAAVASGQVVPPEQWLAGYYFNNALIRLAVAQELVGKRATARSRRPSIRDEVNIFKHEVEGLWVRGRTVDIGGALRELDNVVKAFRGRVGK